MKPILNSILLFLLTSLILNACNGSHNKKLISTHVLKPEFQTLIDSANVEGSVLIHDLNNDGYYSNDFNWAEIARLPASTFKIPNSIIALELGVVDRKIIDNEKIFKWNGQDRFLKAWEQDLTLKKAYHYSCMPCYQEIARKIGTGRMNQYLDKLKFGEMVVNNETLDQFWLVSDSTISQFQQIDFLKRLYLSELPVSKVTIDAMKNMMVVKATNEYTISAKTGLSVRLDKYNGWYVGYVETIGNVFFFATNISPLSEYNKNFNALRKFVTFKALEKLGIEL